MRFIPLFALLLAFFISQAQYIPAGVIGSERMGLVQLNRPAVATFGPDGLLYFINENSDEIFVYTSDGDFIKSISTIFNGESFRPSSIAINDAGLIYLSSAYSSAIVILDSEGNFLQEISSFGHDPGQVYLPLGITIDGSGNIWVADHGNNRVQQLNATGTFILEFSSTAPYTIKVTSTAVYVSSVALNSIKKFSLSGILSDEMTTPQNLITFELVAEDYFYVSTGNGIFRCNLIDNNIFQIPEPQNDYPTLAGGLALQNDKLFITDFLNRVFVYNTQSNSLEIFLECKADGQFNTPTQMVRDEDQNIYVVDQNNHRIQVFDSGGNFIRKFGSYGANNGELMFPQDIAIDSNGDCYVTSNNGVSVFNNQGIFLRRFSVDGYGVAVDQNNVYIVGSSPLGIHRLDKNGVFQEVIIEGGTEPGKVDGVKDFVIDEDGNFYVAEMVGKRVQIFDNNGVLLRVIGQAGTGDGEFSSPIAIASDDQERIYVTDDLPFGSDRAQVFDQNGNLLAIIGQGIIKDPNGIVVNSDGRVYVSDAFNHRIQIFRDLMGLQDPEISVDVPEKMYGDPQFELEVNSNSNGALSFRVLNGTAAEITDEGLITILGAGHVSIEISQVQTPEYAAGTLIVSLEIAKATLVVTADDDSRTYGIENPAFTFQYQGFKNGDTFSDINTAPQSSTNATITSQVGDYAIVLSQASDNNYAFTYVSGLLTIEKASLVVTAENKVRRYGEENPEFTVQYNGFMNNDTFSDLNTQPVINTNADITSPVGSYPIEVEGASDNNYDIEYVSGELVVEKASLIVTIDNASRVYGDENPEFSSQYDGFVNNDAISDLDAEPVLITTTDEASSVGNYLIIGINASDNNYDFVYLPGILSISKALLTAKAEDKSREYNAANPEFTIEYEGFKNNDDASDLIAAPSSTTTANQNSPIGTYAIILAGGVATNYDFMLVNGQLTITKANQQISFGPLPSPVFSTLAPFALNATSGSGLSITYQITAGPASVATNIVTLSGDLGIVTIEATQSGNENYEAALPVSQSFEVVEAPVVGIEDENAGLNVYPNPSKGQFWLSSPEGIHAYQILNGKGSLMMKQDGLGKEEHLVNIESLSDGIYILIVQTLHGKKLTRKISVVR